MSPHGQVLDTLQTYTVVVGASKTQGIARYQNSEVSNGCSSCLDASIPVFMIKSRCFTAPILTNWVVIAKKIYHPTIKHGLLGNPSFSSITFSRL